MAPRDEKPERRKRVGNVKRDELHHLLRTGQANAERRDIRGNRRPKPSLPPTPWDKKPDVAD